MQNSWDGEWRRRTQGNRIEINKEKLKFLTYQLWSRPWYAKLKKLDIGCGLAIHAREMKDTYVGWADKYYGLDLSETAIEKAKQSGLNVWVGSIFEMNHHNNFDVFFLFDVLEHIEDHDRLAEKIKGLAVGHFIIFGNIPLYLTPSKNGLFERPMNIVVLSEFLKKCGLGKLWYKVYDVVGLPYMVFEATNADTVRENINPVSPS